MAVIYRTTGVWGAGQGSNLSAAQVDGNFWDHEGRIVALETAQPQPNDIASMDITGNKLTLTLVSGAALGPVYLPVLKWRSRGYWAAFGIYATLDVFVISAGANAGIYVARLDHTAAATFDPNAVGAAVTAPNLDVGVTYVIANVADTDFTLVGAASNTVGLAFVATAAGTGSGTATPKLYDQIIATADLASFDLQDLADVVITGPAGSDLLVWDDASPGSWVNKTPTEVTALLDPFVGDDSANPTSALKGLVPAPAQDDAVFGKYLDAGGTWSRPQSAVATRIADETPLGYTLVIGDLDAYLRLSDGGLSPSLGVGLTVPTDASVDFPIGATVAIEQSEAGAITIAGAGGVTINLAATHTPVTNGQFAVVELKKVAINEWVLFGNLVPV